MKTILHIGQHKTGTTSLQHYLRDHREELMQRGVYVPAGLAGSREISHFMLNVAALSEERSSPAKDHLIRQRGPEHISRIRQRVREEIPRIYQEASAKECDRVLWSNEGLYLLNSVEEYERLYRLFSDVSSEVEVVCCFREVTSFRNSYRRQLLRQGIPLSEDPDSYRCLDAASWLFDFAGKKTLLEAVFDTCRYFSYDPEDNVTAFLQTLGLGNAHGGGVRFNVTRGGFFRRLFR